MYFNPQYVRLYEDKDHDTFKYVYKKNHHIFQNVTLLNTKTQTLKSPYGYGGYNINTNNPDFIADALHKYTRYCKSNNIKSETIMQFPLHAVCEPSFFDKITLNRPVVTVNLLLPPEERIANYSKTTRNIINNNKNNIKTYKSFDLDKFIKLYEQTMAKNNAPKKYCFNRDYYENLLQIHQLKLYETKLDNITLCMGIFAMNSEFASYHLSANTEASYDYHGNYHLLHNMFDIAKFKGAKTFLLGGGKTTNPADALLNFKKKFSKQARNFYILEKEF